MAGHAHVWMKWTQSESRNERFVKNLHRVADKREKKDLTNVATMTELWDMLGPPVSGAGPGFPGDPVFLAYPRLAPAAGSWMETRQPANPAEPGF
jgi:hypothetical protein